jgi:hypothetical protein
MDLEEKIGLIEARKRLVRTWLKKIRLYCEKTFMMKGSKSPLAFGLMRTSPFFWSTSKNGLILYSINSSSLSCSLNN